jgi:hypothetical protein
MAQTSPSPFARPDPGLRIKEGAPPLRRLPREEAASLPRKALDAIDRIGRVQAGCLSSGGYDLGWVEGRHFVVAGGTGAGLGGALSIVLEESLRGSGSLTVISRDLTRSLGYEMGVALERMALSSGMANRFHWLNDGLALEGRQFGRIVAALKEAGAGRVVYINTVAAAHCGLLPGYPPVFVKDVDDQGLFQWRLAPLEAAAIEATKFVMGTMAVGFPCSLEQEGIQVEAAAFADWRGSLDRISRDPTREEYGRQGAYSTSLYLPKDIIQEAVRTAYMSGRIVIDCFFPIMRTQALSFVPGGYAMSYLYDWLMQKEGVRRKEVPELAVAMLDRIGKAISGEYYNPFPRLDEHEAPLDLWFFEILTRLSNDEDSDFYYERFLPSRKQAAAGAFEEMPA